MSRHARLGCLAIVLLAACSSGSDPIYIGLAGAFDDPVGRPMTLGAQLAVDEINAAGGVNGRPLALLERNDYGDPDSAVMVAIDLYASDVLATPGQ